MTTQALSGVSDAQLDVLKSEAMQPETSPDFVDLGDQDAKALAAELRKELAELRSAEDPDTVAIDQKQNALDAAQKRFKRVQVRMLNLGAERRIVKLLAPHVGLLGQLEDNSLSSMGELLGALADVLPEAVAIAFQDQGITVEWLDSYSNSDQVIQAVRAHLGKINKIDLLGKLLPSGGLKG